MQPSTQPSITIENLSKQYRLGTVSAGTLKGDFQRWFHQVRGKADPFLEIGQENALDQAEGEYIWALRDINLEVMQGEVLGIIGKNGAGKSTLLKILSRVTGPTTGTVRVKGRIASLLEVGTGFHPELTGKENIYLNGAILGMKKGEIRSKLDEIIYFAGVAKYINTPVKRYSSGMYVRLAFAVAAHLEPDILIVDEVLAVGDADFQKKAIGKMKDVSIGEGRTVLFVSHNMASIQKLCTQCILFKNGKIEYEGFPLNAIQKYLEKESDSEKITYIKSDSDKKIWISKFEIESHSEVTNKLILGNKIRLITYYKSSIINPNCQLYIGIYNKMEEKILHLGTPYFPLSNFLKKEEGKLVCTIDKLSLAQGSYYVNLSLHLDNKPYDHVLKAVEFIVENADFYKTGKLPDSNEIIYHIPQLWEEE